MLFSAVKTLQTTAGLYNLVFLEINSVYKEDCQPRFFSLLVLLHSPVIRRNCLTFSFTM